MAKFSEISHLIVDGDWIESKDQSETGFRLIQTGNIGIGKYLDKPERAKYISEQTFTKLKCTEVLEGDILISRLPDPIGRACVVPKLPTRNITAVDCSIVRLDETMCDKMFFIYYTCSDVYQSILSSFFTGTTRTRISRKNLEKTYIPLPPLETQKQIAATLDKVTALIDMHKRQLELLEELVKGRFVEMFGDTCSNPMNWNRKTFRQVAKRLSDGPFGSNLKSEHYSDCGVRVVRLGNIGVGAFIDKDKSFIPIEHYEKLKKYTCRTGDIVIGTLGEPNLRACRIPDYIDIAINKADCVHFVPNDEVLNVTFACQYINCPETLVLASSMVHGQTRTRISSGQIAELPIYLPPLELQTQFAAFVTQTDKSKSSIQQSLAKLETLKKSLMQEYFG